MAHFYTENALIFIDFINEMIDEKGKLSGKGYFNFAQEFNSIEKAKNALEYARNNNFVIIHIRVGFSNLYQEQPEHSILFGGAKKFEALKIGSWGNDFIDLLKPNNDEISIYKNRVSGFYGTNLDIILKNFGVKNIYIAGCSTDMAVQTTIREAHDRDFNCFVLEDACVGANITEHNNTISLLQKVSTIIKVDDFVK